MTNPFLTPPKTQTQTQGLTISDSAVKRLNTLFSQDPEKSVFRITIIGGGCSGFQYTFDMDTQTHDTDFTIPLERFCVACDRDSLSYIDGGHIHFIDSLAGQYFTIENPNATANCGCGTSFSI